jgi:hypothetical protein
MACGDGNDQGRRAAAAVAILAVRGLPGRVANMFALTLIFAGGAASKLASGWLAAARGT